MSTRKPMSRRAFLRGAGGAIVALPFLEAMLPARAWSAPALSRMVAVYGGVPTYMTQSELPFGALGATLPPSISALASVRQYVTVLTNMKLPEYLAGATAPAGGCVLQQHYTAAAPSLAGVTSQDAKPMMYQAHTIDQVFADAVGTGTRFNSIQACVQAVPYSGKVATTSVGGQVSSRFENGQTNVQQPIVSPLELYNKLFSISTPPPSGTTVSSRQSVLDLVLGDAARVSASLSNADKARLDQHFDQIRQIERSLASTTPPPTGGGSCTTPTKPGADTPPSTYNFGGWAAETQRRDLQADILALALACNLTRAMSWQLTYDQCFVGGLNISGINNDLHQISHDVSNDTTGTLRPAMRTHFNWHCAGFARLVQNLANLPEGTGTVLDNTFLGMCFGEGIAAHNRNTMHMVIAGTKGKVNLGQHINGAGEHTARVWIAGMNSQGLTRNTLGEISNPMASILK